MRNQILLILLPVLMLSACIGGGNNATVHVRGPDNATVTIVEYSDFQCPACGAAAPIIADILEAYPTQVKFIYKDFPLSFHSYAQKASEAAECAGAQGKYWEMFDKLFANQEALTVSDLKGYAAELGLNTTEFDACLDSGRMEMEVKLDADEGKRLSIRGTPTFFVNDERIVGVYPFTYWQHLIDTKLG